MNKRKEKNKEKGERILKNLFVETTAKIFKKETNVLEELVTGAGFFKGFLELLYGLVTLLNFTRYMI